MTILLLILFSSTLTCVKTSFTVLSIETFYTLNCPLGNGDTEHVRLANQIWVNLRPTPREKTYVIHCLHGKKLEIDYPRNLGKNKTELEKKSMKLSLMILRYNHRSVILIKTSLKSRWEKVQKTTVSIIKRESLN